MIVSLFPILVNKYSPSPLNVYEKPSDVTMWGSPNHGPETYHGKFHNFVKH